MVLLLSLNCECRYFSLPRVRHDGNAVVTSNAALCSFLYDVVFIVLSVIYRRPTLSCLDPNFSLEDPHRNKKY